MDNSKRSGRITANITPERIREALAAGHNVYVEGHDEHYDCDLRGVAIGVQDFAPGPNVAFRDETPGGPFEGKHVGLYVSELTEVLID